MREGRQRPSLFNVSTLGGTALEDRNEGGAPAPLVGSLLLFLRVSNTDRNEGGAPAPLVVT